MFEYTFMQNAFIVSLLISLLCPLIGIFLVLRRYSMIGDALSHASLAGVAMGLLLKSTPIMGAFWMTSFFGLLIEALRERFRRYAELTLVIVMSFSVGLAITLVSSGLVKANIDSFLFGSILTVGREEVYLVGALTFVSVLAVWGLYPQLVMLSFDEDGARISGVPRRAIKLCFFPACGGHHFCFHPHRRYPCHQLPHCPSRGNRPAAEARLQPDAAAFGSF